MNFIKNIYNLIFYKGYFNSQIENYSLLSIFLNRRVIRKDYAKYTAEKYVKNCGGNTSLFEKQIKNRL